MIQFERRHRRSCDAELFHLLGGPWEGLELEELEAALSEAYGFAPHELTERSRGRATSQLRALVAALAHDLLAVSTTELRWRYKVDRRTIGRDLYDGRDWVRRSPEVRALLRRALPRFADRLEGPGEPASSSSVELPPPPPPRVWRYAVEPGAPYAAPTAERRAALLQAVAEPTREPTRLLGSEDPTATRSAWSAAPTWVMPQEDG